MAPSIELKIKALYNCWTFFDLIKYKGGTSNFDQCHFDFILCLQAPQLYDQGMLVGNLYERWHFLTEGDWDVPPDSVLLEFPRGHLKSTLVIGYIMWRVYRNPNIKALHATNIRDLSESFIRELRAYFEDEHLLTNVWNSRPHIRGNMVPDLDRTNRRAYSDENEAKDRKVVWSNYQLQMVRPLKSKEPTIMSTSVKAKSTGAHYNLVVMDDIVDFENSETEIKNKRVKRWAADISSVLTRTPHTEKVGTLPDGTPFYETLRGEFVVTGTHYSPFDYYTFLEERYKGLKCALFRRNIYVNGHDNTDGYLWTGFSESLELQLREELSESPGVFEAQYLNHVNNPALQILSTDLVEYIPRNALLQGRGEGLVTYSHPDTGKLETIRPIITVDPAVSLRARADYTAIMVGGISTERNLALIDSAVGHFTPEKTLDEVIRLAKLWGVTTVHCEVVGFQSLLRTMLIKRVAEEKMRLGILSYMPNKWGKKEKRIEMFLSPYFSNGNVVMSEQIKQTPMVINTFTFFGRGGRDDPPDAAAIIAEVSHAPGEKGKSKRKYLVLGTTPNNFNSAFGGIY